MEVRDHGLHGGNQRITLNGFPDLGNPVLQIIRFIGLPTVEYFSNALGICSACGGNATSAT
jgi:hypothetical protein